MTGITHIALPNGNLTLQYGIRCEAGNSHDYLMNTHLQNSKSRNPLLVGLCCLHHYRWKCKAALNFPSQRLVKSIHTCTIYIRSQEFTNLPQQLVYSGYIKYNYSQYENGLVMTSLLSKPWI